jgi:hypothetical protein
VHGNSAALLLPFDDPSIAGASEPYQPLALRIAPAFLGDPHMLVDTAPVQGAAVDRQIKN